MNWTREDVRYAVATGAAIVLVAALAAGNFGLLPSPLPGADREPVDDVTVPVVAAGGQTAAGGGGPADNASGVDEAASVLGEVVPPSPSPDPTPAPADATSPVTTFITADGTIMARVDNAPIRGEVTDAGSGVDSVKVTFDGLLTAPQTVQARVSCESPERRRCTWEADAPSRADTYTVSAQSTDRADNVESPGPDPIDVTIVTTDPGGTTEENDDGGGGLLGGLVEGAKGLLGL